MGMDTGSRRYREARLEPGDLVTIVGTALPFGHLRDPDGADRLDRFGDPFVALDDPILAAEIAAARAAGTLLTPEEAWGNAGIEGFGIGRPVRAPELDPRVAAPVLATRPSQVGEIRDDQWRQDDDAQHVGLHRHHRPSRDEEPPPR